MYCKQLLKVCLLCLSFVVFNSFSINEANRKYAFESNREVRENLSQGLHEMMNVKVTKQVKKYIDSYLIRGKKGTQIIIGNASIYFPIYESYLAQYNLPDELKYLSVIESSLNPNAESPVGAVGLWQFMAPTARQMGLIIDDYVDERKDIYRSTEAAVKYLKQLHERYDDWSLALAAYNCGLGRVDRTLQEYQGRTFEDIKNYLPKETQLYIDRFVAANYALKNYQFYNLRPNYPDYTLQMTQVFKINARYSFEKLAHLTGIDKRTIKKLNPSYRKGIIPPNLGGYNLILPEIGVNEDWNG